MSLVQEAIQDFDRIPRERKDVLLELAGFVRDRIRSGEEAKLIFICTHNSRRSHMGQLWAQRASAHYGVPGVRTFSGGTQATAFNPRAVAALRRAGFEIEKTTEGENPRYRVVVAAGLPAQEAFSKTYDDPANPRQGFAAVMTCSQAEQNCPLVSGASRRISLPYEDPQEYDNTSQEAARYDERSRQIATEMFYCFAQLER